MLGRYRWAALAGAMLVGLPCSPALAQGAQPAPAAAGDPMAQATARFFAGQKLYNDKKFEEALVEFRASYAAAPSPNSRLYVARCLRRVGRNGAAYEEYSQVIREAAERAAEDKRYAATQQAATEERAEIKDKVGTIRVAVPAGVTGVTVRVGAEEVPAARWGQPIPADVGSVTVRAEAPGRAPFEKSVEVKPGEQQEVAVDLGGGAGQESGGGGGGSSGGGGGGGDAGGGGFNFMSDLPLRTMAIASGGVGVVGLAMWGIFGSAASSRFDDLERKCAGRCDSFYQDDVDAGRRETAMSTAGLVIGVLGVAGGVTFFTIDYMNRKSAGNSQSSGGGATISVGVAPSPGGSYVTVGGVF